jgi:ParB family chromosome partitioning protein
MSDRSDGTDFEDILTGRSGSRSRPAKRNATTDTGESTSASRPARSRRRFTVDALFSDTRQQAMGVEDLVEAKEISLDRIVADPEQPRRTFDQERLEELVASIKAEGVLQPIVVRYEAENDHYVVVHGERRFRASIAAERSTIPALVRDVPADRRLVQQLMENIVRDDLNAVDRARALRTLKAQMQDASWDDVASEVGIRRSRLFQLLDTAKLSDATQDHIRTGTLSEKQSRALQGLSNHYQQALSDAIVDRAIPSQLAMRLGRALRKSSRPAPNVVTARAHIDELLDIAITTGDQAHSVQVDQLLDALASSTPTTQQADRSEIDILATLLGAPRYSSETVTKSVGALSLALSRAEWGELRNNPDLARRLKTLTQVIEQLIDENGLR